MTTPRLLRAGPFRTLLVGQTVSAIGDWMGTFAFIALVYQQSGSPTAVGGILALRLLPAAIGGPLAARAASRWDRRKTMVTMDTLRAGMIALVPLIRTLWWIYLWAFLVEAASLVFLPARDATTPELVEPDDLELANGFVLGSSYGSIPLGAAIYAVIAALPGHSVLGRTLPTVFWVDAATFLVSAAMISRLPQPSHGEAVVAGAPSGEALPKVRFRDAFALPLVRAVMPATVAVALGLGALFSLGIEFVRQVLHAGDAAFGVLIVLFGAGAGVGLVLLQRFRRVDRIRSTRLGVFGLGVIVAAFSLSPAVAPAFIGAGVFGAATAWTLASGMGALQSLLEGQDRVIAFAAFHIVIRSGLALAAVGAGAAGQLVGNVRWPALGTLAPSRLVLFCSGILVALSSAGVRMPEARTSKSSADRPRPDHT